MSEEIRISPIYILDSKEVVSFLQTKYDDLGRSIQFWTDRTTHWWLKNPYFNEKLPIGWGIWDGKELKGYIGCIFTGLNYRGSIQISLNLTCWYVEPKYRAYSLDLFIKANSFMPEAVYFNTSPSPQVENILKASKYHKYILGKDKILTKIIPLNLNSIPVGTKFLFFKKIIRPIIILVDSIIKISVKLIWDNKNIVVTDLNEVSQEYFDYFFHNNITEKLTIDRSFIFYNWLLSARYNKFHLLILQGKSDSEILAVGLFYTLCHKNTALLELIDFKSTNDGLYNDKILLRKMITHIFSNELFNNTYSGISITEYCGVDLKNSPGRFFFRSRNNKYYKTADSNLKSIFENNNCDLTAVGDMYL